MVPVTITADGGARAVSNTISYEGMSYNTFVIGGSNNLTLSGTIAMGLGFLKIDNTALTTFSGPVSSSLGFLEKMGSGTLRLSGNVANSGGLFVAAGTVELNKTVANGAVTGLTTINPNGTIRLLASNQIADSSDVNVGTGALLDLNGYSDTVGSLTVTSGTATTGGGTLTTGALTMTGGSIATGAGALILNGTLTNNANATAATISGNLNASGTAIVLNVSSGDGASELDIPAVISNGSLIKTGGGTLKLSGSNTYSGGVQLSQGSLAIGNNAALGTGTFSADPSFISVLIDADGGPRTVSNPVNFSNMLYYIGIGGSNELTFSGTIALDGNISFSNTALTTFSGPVNSSGVFVKNGAGTLLLSGSAANVIKNTLLYSGLLQLNKTVADGAISGSLQISRNGATAVARLLASNQIADSSDVSIEPGGLLDLNGYSDTVGSLTMLYGRVTTGTGTLSLTTGTLTSYGGSSVSGNLNAGGASLVLDVSSNGDLIELDIPAVISNGGLVKTGEAGLRLSGSNTFSGGVQLKKGTLVIGNNAALGTGTLQISPEKSEWVVVFADGGARTVSNSVAFPGDSRTLAIYGTNSLTLSGPISLGGGVLNIESSALTTFSGPVTNSGDFFKEGSGALRLSGSTANTTGKVWVSCGVLELNKSVENGAISGDLSISGNGSVVRLLASNQIADSSNVSLVSRGLLDLNGYSDTIGSLTITSGSVTTGAGTLTVTGTAIQSAGTAFAGTLISQGSFTYNGGTFNGRLVNQGAATFNASFTAGNGLENDSTLSASAGCTLTVNGSGLDNEGNIALTGGTLTGSGPLVNNCQIAGYATIGGSGGFTNNSTFTQSGGPVTLGNTGPNANYGNMTLVSGYQFRLSSGISLTNAGSLNLNGGTIALSGTLINTYGGSVLGIGTITAPFLNSGGTINPGIGTLNITQGFANNGTIQLGGFGSSLNGGAIVNNGSIQGQGNVGNALTNYGAIQGQLTLSGSVSNAGTIEPLGGVITLNGSFQNQSTGLISIPAGNKLLTLAGLSTNAGTISLAGGTFDNNGHPLNNTGLISGYGVIHSGTLTNNGSIVFTSGATTIDADVVNPANELVRVAYGSATFSGNVTNSGTFTISQATVTFSKTFTNYGTVLTNTTGQVFSTLSMASSGFLSGGATVGNLQMNGGSIATGPATLAMAGNIASTGSGASISGNLNLGGTNRVVNVASGGGSVDLSVSAAVSNGSITKTGVGTLLLSGSVTLAGLNANEGGTQLGRSGTIGALSIASSGTVSLTPNTGTYKVIDTSALSISGGGHLDLWNNAMILRASGSSQNAINLAAVQAGVNAASDGLLWDGVGIGSTTAFNEVSNTQALALMVYDNTVITQSTFEGVSGLGYFDGGNPVGFNQVLVKLTYLGDFNADGMINASDYTWLDGFALGGSALGDLNGDGLVNATDYTWLDGSALNQSFGILATQQDSGSAVSPLQSVPEPGTLGMLLVGVFSLLGLRPKRPLGIF